MSQLDELQGRLLELGFDRGRRDITFFAEQILGIDLNRAQRRLFRIINPGEDGWQWRYRLVVEVAANQVGKTVGVAILILWAANYKIGIDPSDWDRWLGAAWEWFHVSPNQQQAYLPLSDIRQILRGTHRAQRRQCRFTNLFVHELKIEQYYDGLEFWNGALVQFRTTKDYAEALAGRRAAGISFDEAAFEPHLNHVVHEILMMRLISTGGPLLLISTPNGINEFHDFVVDIQSNGQDVGDMTWVTPTQHALVWATITDNVGFGITAEQAARMEADLDPATREQQLRGAFLEPADAFFVPAKPVVDAFRDIPEETPPKPGHRYVIFWDPSVRQDPTAAIVLDVTTPVWTGVCYRYYNHPLTISKLLVEMYGLHELYSGKEEWGNDPLAVVTGYDATAMGGQILRQELVRLRPQRPINFGGPSSKINLLTNLRAAFAQSRLLLPRKWNQLYRELLNYRIQDDKIAQDSVMALAGAAQLAATRPANLTRPFQPGGVRRTR